MSRVHDGLAVIGVAAVMLGFLLIVRPAYAAALTVPRTTLVVLGLIAVVEGLRSVRTRRRSDIEGADPPDPESGIELSVPGEDFDDLVARWSTRSNRRRVGSVNRRVQNRLEDAAVRAIMHRETIPRERAEERLAAGTWTDDPVAAALLGGAEAPSIPLSVQLGRLFGGRSTSQFYVDRTTDAIAGVWEDR